MLLLVLSLLIVQGCKDGKTPVPTSDNTINPVLRWQAPAEDKASQTFNLALQSDSTGEADVTFRLLDCGQTMMEKNGKEVEFTGIAPLDEGYDVEMVVKSKDTTIVRTAHVMGFVLIPDPVVPMTAEELQQLINSKDESLKRGENDRLAQSPKITVSDARLNPGILREVIRLVEYGEWESVVVTAVEHDANNQIVAISLKPVGEKPEEPEPEDLDEDF